MRHFPLHLTLSDRLVLIIGGTSNQAISKARLFIQAGAKICFHSSRLGPEAEAMVEAGLAFHREVLPSSAEDFTNAAFIVIADEPGLSLAELAQLARASGLPTNVIDRPDLSTALIPAIVDRGEVVVSISTGGAAPVLARRLRERIEALLPARIDMLARFAASFRETVRSLVPSFAERRRLWEQFFDGNISTQVLAGDTTKAREAMLSFINGSWRQSPMKQGSVHLVGAGPGDPDLLTLKALQLLQNADVILHDQLVSSEILQRARREAKVIPVGKRAGRHSMSQDEINMLMVAEVKRGHRVIRLKGGDPLIFGRGGEEIEYLRSHGIEVDVVPGITAALGCAAGLGLPLTHRNLSSGLSLVAGTRQDGAPDPDWAALARSGQTLAIYMARAQAAAIGAQLISSGLSAGTPVVAIENGTRPEQRVAVGVLSDLGPLVGNLDDGDGPLLMLIGESVRAAKAWAPQVPSYAAIW